MQRVKNKKVEIAGIRRDLAGERQVNLNRLAGDTGTDEGERRNQLIWQNFRIVDCTKATAAVLGTDHPKFCEGKEAAAENAQELFETELFSASGGGGVPIDRLSTMYSHYFGAGFERVVGKRLREFCQERFEYDDKTGRVKASAKVLTALRKGEARELLSEEIGQMYQMKRQRRDTSKPEAAKPPVMLPSQTAYDPDQRPRYASTKMQPDELEERGGGFDGKGGGKGLF